jgi:hypothetical protein
MIYGLRFYRASVKVEHLPSGSPLFIHSRLNEEQSDLTRFSRVFTHFCKVMFISMKKNLALFSQEEQKKISHQMLLNCLSCPTRASVTKEREKSG